MALEVIKSYEFIVFPTLSFLAEYANIKNTFLVLQARRNRRKMLMREWNI
jgi:hypothetical protein